MKLSLKIAIIVLLGIVLSVAATNYLVLPLTTNIEGLLKVLLIFVLVIAPSALIVWFLIYLLIIVPILKMEKISSIIARGNLGQRIEIKSTDEIGELGRNFNMVINNLTSGMQHMANLLRDEKQKEKELAISYQVIDKEKAKDEALLTSIGDAVIAIDNTQRIILFNEAASKMVGVEPGAITGHLYQMILRFQDETTKTPAPDFINMALKGEKAVGSRMMLQTMNGQLLPVLHTTSPIFDNKKEITGVVVILKDITQERELEKLKDEFVSLASHELRTPMTAIKGLISMILEGDYGKINESLKDPLSDVFKSSERLIQLVNDMLDVSRIEAGRTKISISPVSVADLVAETVGMLKLIADQKNIKLEVKESVIHKVSADPDKLKQILINLINNAIKFTDHGNVIVSFRSWGKFAYISVTDSGVGITKEDQVKLFSKFSQISNSQSGRPPGTGLGLYISREFARKMGGEMWIERSEIGKGSTFTFALPFAKDMI